MRTPQYRVGLRIWGGGYALGALAWVLFTTAHLWGDLIQLDHPVPAVAQEVACDRGRGGIALVYVNGIRRECTGARRACPSHSERRVVYDAAQPHRCRIASSGNTLSEWELGNLLLGSAFFCLGLGMLTIEEHSQRRVRRHGAHLVFAVGLLLVICAIAFFDVRGW